MVAASPDPAFTARRLAKLALLSLLRLAGPIPAAEAAYRLADGLADAAGAWREAAQ